MNYHPAADVFPLMDGLDLGRLADDIREHGLLEPIVLYEGMVLDGRNRLRACELATVEPRFEEWDANGHTPTEWVVSMNLHRRHLTTAQRAALALDLLPKLEEEARERQEALGRTHGTLSPETDEGSTGRSDEKAAALVGVGRSTVAATKAIQNRNPEVVDRMRSGELTVSAAARAAGFEGAGTGRVNAPIEDGSRSVYYGKGDKWRETTEPLRRYLRAHGKGGFSYGHVPPKEAQKRLEVIDVLVEGLLAARSELEQRSHVYRLSA